MMTPQEVLILKDPIQRKNIALDHKTSLASHNFSSKEFLSLLQCKLMFTLSNTFFIIIGGA